MRRTKRATEWRPVFIAAGLLVLGFLCGVLAGSATAAVEPTPAEWPDGPVPFMDVSVLGLFPEAAEPELTYVGTFTAYAYCPCAKCCGEWSGYNLTASGTAPAEGRTVAADWDVLPAGTEVYIDGLGWRTVEDTGRGIAGDKLDVFMESHDSALMWGVREVEVYVYKR